MDYHKDEPNFTPTTSEVTANVVQQSNVNSSQVETVKLYLNISSETST